MNERERNVTCNELFNLIMNPLGLDRQLVAFVYKLYTIYAKSPNYHPFHLYIAR